MRRLVALVIVGRSVIGHSCPCRLLGPQAIYMKSAPLGVDACCASMLAAVVCSVHEMVVYMGKSLPLLSMSSSARSCMWRNTFHCHCKRCMYMSHVAYVQWQWAPNV